MSKILFIALISGALLACNQNDGKITTDIVNNPSSASGEKNEKLPELTFEEEVFDFGTITQGEKVSHDFVFKNTGDADLVITSAKGSCGCTVPDWPKKPIAPGGTGEIHVIFDSEGKSGAQHKKVTVLSNTQPNTTVVAVKGNIAAPEVD